MGYGWHWTTSSIAGLVLTGRFAPLCALAYAAPECMARRAFLRLMDRVFEPDHCRRVWLTYRIGRALRCPPRP